MPPRSHSGRDPHARAAVVLRRWDDQAKDRDAAPPSLDEYHELLEGLAR